MNKQNHHKTSHTAHVLSLSVLSLHTYATTTTTTRVLRDILVHPSLSLSLCGGGALHQQSRVPSPATAIPAIPKFCV